MNRIIEFIKSRRLYWWLTFGAEVFSLAALILYAVNGVTNFDPHHSVQVIAGLIISLVLGVAVMAIPPRFPIRFLVFAQYVLSVFALFSYIFSNMNLLGSMLYSAGGQQNIDGTTVPAPFVLLIIFMAIALVASLVAGITMRPAKIAEEGKTA